MTEAAFASALAGNKAYWEIHTSAFPNGEIRGFLNTPEPGSCLLASIGMVALVGLRYRRGMLAVVKF